MGHQGQGAGRARFTNCSAARRGNASASTPCAARPRSSKGSRGLHRLQDRAGQPPAAALYRDARPRSVTPSSKFAELRTEAGDDVDIAIDFHGKISPALAKVLIKALEPHQPMFIEEPINCQNHDMMAEIARGTHLPIATGERVFTKWGFREVLEKGAATILQPDLCHAGGITEVRLIAGMAEAYYAAIAPHNPLGPISLAAGVQIAASIPNFLCQEQVAWAKAT